MASNADVARRLARVLMSRPEVRRRARPGEPVGLSTKPNAPRLITIVVALLLTIVGIAVSLTPIQPVLDLLANVDLELTKEQGWLALVASPLLLVAGSYLRGV